MAWLQEHGARFKKIEWPSYATESGVRGAVALADIDMDEDMVSIPEHLMLTPLVALEDPEIGHVFEENLGQFADEDILIVLLMHERAKGAASFFFPYLDILPQSDGLMEWDDEALALLQDEDLCMQVHLRRSQMEAHYTRLIEDGLKAQYPQVFGVVGLPEAEDPYSFAQFTFAYQTIQARAFGRRLPYSALVPFSDGLNHDNVAMHYRLENLPESDKSPPLRAFHLFPSRTIRKGQEVFISYGRRTNGQLLLGYGFALLDNEHEVVDLEVPAIPSPPSWFRASVAKLGPKVGEVFKATHPLPAQATTVNDHLLAYYRAVVACRQGGGGGDVAVDFCAPLPTPALETEALRTLQAHLAETLAAYPTTIEEDEAALRGGCGGQDKTAYASTKIAAAIYRLTRKRILRQHLRLVERESADAAAHVH